MAIAVKCLVFLSNCRARQLSTRVCHLDLIKNVRKMSTQYYFSTSSHFEQLDYLSQWSSTRMHRKALGCGQFLYMTGIYLLTNCSQRCLLNVKSWGREPRIKKRLRNTDLSNKTFHIFIMVRKIKA
jgi:hypothetical protein